MPYLRSVILLLFFDFLDFQGRPKLVILTGDMKWLVNKQPFQVEASTEWQHKIVRLYSRYRKCHAHSMGRVSLSVE